MMNMDKIDAYAKSVNDLLSNKKYAIDYYQREYKWETKQVTELLEDLEAKFLDGYEEGHVRTEVEHYRHYFLGSIIVSNRDGKGFIIDGQQRLTSLTLLLIYLHHLQQERYGEDEEEVQSLIFSQKHGQKSFNLDIPERNACMDSLFKGQTFDPTDQSESVRNIVARYAVIQENFPETLRGESLIYFIDWLKNNVDLIEITAYSDDEAYTIFETMNDRGLSLSPTDMLKGYLLANIADAEERAKANNLWKDRLLDLSKSGKEEDADFFKAWLRAKYADTIRERKKGAVNKDFDIIGTTFHKWIHDESKRIGLKSSMDFRDFVMKVSNFSVYVSREIKKPYEIEHIWADHYERHTDEFATEEDFAQYRNRIGNLILLPGDINKSINDSRYGDKLLVYRGQNVLAQSLDEQFYYNNPSFLAYKNRSNLPFHPRAIFKKADLDARQELYRLICEEIWSPSRFDKELE